MEERRTGVDRRKGDRRQNNEKVTTERRINADRRKEDRRKAGK